jgi:hypothetical protein
MLHDWRLVNIRNEGFLIRPFLRIKEGEVTIFADCSRGGGMVVRAEAWSPATILEKEIVIKKTAKKTRTEGGITYNANIAEGTVSYQVTGNVLALIMNGQTAFLRRTL